MKSFTYRTSRRISHWGCAFDSLAELRFALSIQKDYEFLRSHIPIYYDPKSKLPTHYIRENIRRYTPDFLIRHKQTLEALWVEVKPGGYTNVEQLELRKTVAENYIRWKNYDWKYKVVFDHEIKLNDEQWKQFDQCRRWIERSEYRFEFEELNKKYDVRAPSFFKTVPSSSNVEFVMFGRRRNNG